MGDKHRHDQLTHRVLGIAGLALVGLGLVGLFVNHVSAIAFAQAESEWAHTYYETVQCVGDMIFDETSENDVIFIDTDGGALGLEWTQRLTEISFPERMLTDVREAADFTVGLTPREPSGHCGRFDVVILPARA